MDYGAAIFFTDYSMGPVQLGRALEERGFGSLGAPEHSHIPLSRRTPFSQDGVLAPHARRRRQIVGFRRSAASEEAAARRAERGTSRGPRSWAWATLMRRAFGIDVLACSRCSCRLRLIATVEDPAVVGTIFAHLALLHPADSPRPAPPSAVLRTAAPSHQSSVPASGLDSAPAGRVLIAPRSPAQDRR